MNQHLLYYLIIYT